MERIQIVWSPKNAGKDSEFLISQEHRRGFGIPDSLRTQERIQNLRSPKNAGDDSEFLIPKKHRRGFRISDPLKTQERIQNFWSPKQHRRFRISDPSRTQESIKKFWSLKQHKSLRISDPPKQYRKVFNISDNPNNLRETSSFSLWSQSSEMSENLRLKSTHDSGAVQGLIVPRYNLVTSNTDTLNFFIEGFSSWCLPERCLIKTFFLDKPI